MKFLRSNINLVMIFAGALGYVLIICLFFYDGFAGSSPFAPDINKTSFFNDHPVYVTWFAVMALQGALWCILLFPATAIILRIKPELGKEFNLLVTFLLLVIILLLITLPTRFIVFDYLTVPTSYFEHQDTKLLTFSSMARGVGLYFIAGIVMVGRKCLKNMQTRDFEIMDYKRLRNYQDVLLNFSALVLSLGVITSILFYKAWSSSHPASSEEFPMEFVIAFGMLNTLLLIVFYLPNYFIMMDYGKRVVEVKFPLENEYKIIIPENIENQSNLSKALKIDLSVTESIKKTLLILSPLLSSLLPRFFDLFGN